MQGDKSVDRIGSFGAEFIVIATNLEVYLRRVNGRDKLM